MMALGEIKSATLHSKFKSLTASSCIGNDASETTMKEMLTESVMVQN